MTKLHEVLAVVQGKTSRAMRELTDLHRRTQVEGLTVGRVRTYEPRDDEGDRLPDESQHVQLVVEDVFRLVARTQTPAFDVVATRDAGNMAATADVVVDGEIVLVDMPAVTLIYLEKRLADLHTFVSKLPVLPAAQRWNYDNFQGVHVSEPVTTVSKRRVPTAFVRFKGDEHHQPQVDRIEVEETVGHWTTVLLSGALPPTRKAELLERVTKLIEAVKVARTRANEVDVEQVRIGQAVFDYLFAR